MINEQQISERYAAVVCHISRQQIQRARQAVKEGRKIGVYGHPKKLQKEQEEELKQWLQVRADTEGGTSFQQFKDKVRT